MGVVQKLDVSSINNLLDDEEFRFSALEDLGTNVMVADKDLNLIYLNKKSRIVLQGLSSVTEQAFGVPYEKMIGGNIGRFHGFRKSQIEQILANPQNLPLNAKISIGDVILDLNVSLVGNFGTTHGYIVNWEDISEKVKFDEEATRLQSMVNSMPINVMLADKDFNITYVNPKSIETLSTLQHLLPVNPNQILGQSIDIFHKNPAHQRKILSNPANLPLRTTITLGDEFLDLNVTGVTGKGGDHLGSMITWSVITDNVNVGNEVGKVDEGVTVLANELEEISFKLKEAIDDTTKQGEMINNLSTEASQGATSAAAATEELASSVREISGQVRNAANLAQEAADKADSTDEVLQTLSKAGNEIEEVIKIIANIANQTNLLALNATIEAARAGEAGKGFAVVASEVKELAKQTSAATKGIQDKIEGVQTSSKKSVEALGEISKTVINLKEINISLAGAIEEQEMATTSISQNTGAVSSNIQEVSQSAEMVLLKAKQNEELAEEIISKANSSAEAKKQVSGVLGFLNDLGWVKKKSDD